MRLSGRRRTERRRHNYGRVEAACVRNPGSGSIVRKFIVPAEGSMEKGMQKRDRSRKICPVFKPQLPSIRT